LFSASPDAINDDEEKSNTDSSAHEMDSDDKEKDPDYAPMDVDDPIDETGEEVPAVAVIASRNSLRETIRENMAFSSSAIKRGFISFDLQAKIEKDGLLRHESAFISEAASFLLQLSKKEKPLISEYDTFCERIVELFPQLKSSRGRHEWVIFFLSAIFFSLLC